MLEALIGSFETALELLRGNVYRVVLGYLLLSEFGAPIPLPGFVVLVAGGYLVGSSGAAPWLLMALAFVALLPGAITLYWIGRRGGSPLLERIGPRIGLPAARRGRIERWLSARAMALVVLRILPTVRVATSIIPGTLGMPWPRYAACMGCALAAWVVVYVGAGYGLALWGACGLAAVAGAAGLALAALGLRHGVRAWRAGRQP